MTDHRQYAPATVRNRDFILDVRRDVLPLKGAGIGLVFSVLLLLISVRQTSIDLFPRPGHAYIGGAIFGLLCLSGPSSSLSRCCWDSRSDGQFFGWPTIAPKTERSILRSALGFYVIIICRINCLSVLVQ